MRLRKEFKFEASHVLPKHPGKCSRLHGHSWILTVSVDGEVDEQTGFVMDYSEISNEVKPLVAKLDHRHLGAWVVYSNQRPGTSESDQLSIMAEIWGGEGKYFEDWYVPDLPRTFNPTSENLIWWIGEQLKDLPWSELELNETCTSACILTREEFNARQDRQG